MISSKRSTSNTLPPSAAGSPLRSVTAAIDPAKVGGSDGAAGPGAAGGGSDSSGTSVSAATCWVGNRVCPGVVGCAVGGAGLGVGDGVGAGVGLRVGPTVGSG